MRTAAEIFRRTKAAQSMASATQKKPAVIFRIGVTSQGDQRRVRPRRRTDAEATETGPDDNLVNRDQDEDRERVEILDDVVRHAIELHRRRLRRQVVIDLSSQSQRA